MKVDTQLSGLVICLVLAIGNSLKLTMTSPQRNFTSGYDSFEQCIKIRNNKISKFAKM